MYAVTNVTKENFSITTDQTLFDFDKIYDFISKKSYWAEGIPMETLKRSVANSLSFSLFSGKEQIGFARVVTDFATFGYLADVFIDDKFRGRNLSIWLMETIIAHPELQGLRRWMLATRDAHGLYEKFGFNSLSKPERMMEKVNPSIYKAFPG